MYNKLNYVTVNGVYIYKFVNILYECSIYITIKEKCDKKVWQV